MTRNVSVLLDLLRLFAALLVLLGHAGEVYGMNLPAMIGHSAKEGVAIFFVLSGLVIAYVTEHKERDWQTFARARMLRMYSVLPLAIVVLCLCYVIGANVAPDIYGEGGGRPNVGAAGQAPDAIAILRYLTFTNELWFDRIVIRTGAPFWSLGYEVAYYVAFATVLYGRGAWRWTLGILWLLAVGPRIVLAFPLWLVGVGTWSILRRDLRLGGLTGSILLALIAISLVAWRRTFALLALPLFEWSTPRGLAVSFSYYLVLCLLLAAAIVVFAASTRNQEIWPQWIEKAVRYCAGASFTLYIAHLPVMVLIAAVWPISSASRLAGLIAIATTIVATFILAEFGERRKLIYIKLLSMRPNSVS